MNQPKDLPKLLKVVGVQYMDNEYGNRPIFVVKMSRVASTNEFIYARHEVDPNSILYLGTLGDQVNFFCHNRLNERGYGGRVYNLRLLDGSTVDIKGPWSSRSGVMNKYFGHSTPAVDDTDCCVEVVGDDCYACSVTATALIKAAKAAGYRVAWVFVDGQWTLEPLHPDGKLKGAPKYTASMVEVD